MSENTAPARCTEAEWKAAREAGMLIVTTTEEIALHKFAELIRGESSATHQPPAPKSDAGVSEPPFGYVVTDTRGGQTFYKSHPYLDTAVKCVPVYLSLSTKETK